MGEYIEVKCPNCSEMVPKSAGMCPVCKQPTSAKPKSFQPIETTQAVKTCRMCGMQVPASAIVCPFCRKPIGMSWPKKMVAGIFILIVGSCVYGQVRSKLDAPTPVRPAAQPVDKYDKTQSLTIRGKTISVGDTYDDVLLVVRPGEMVTQDTYKDTKLKNSLALIKDYNADGKRFRLYISRLEDEGPYQVVGIDAAR